MESLYQPLNVESYEIRMITILPGGPNETIKCKLVQASLLDVTDYIALSYPWGIRTATRIIVVNDIDTPVTVNLADAFQQLRARGVTQIWADALCINQADRQEQSLQIRNMKHIYSQATLVYSWVGESGDGSDALLSFLESRVQAGSLAFQDIPHTETPPIQSSRPLAPVCSDPSIITSSSPEGTNQTQDISDRQCQHCVVRQRMSELKSFLVRPYWKRLWIIQEIAVASRVQVLCGSAEIGLEDLSKCIDRCRDSQFWSSDIEISYFHLERILETRRMYRHERIPLCRAIFMGQRFLAENPRDNVFALLGISYDGADLVPTPNYRQSLDSILRDITRAMIRRNNCLDPILINGIQGTFSPTMPSWIPNWLSAEISEESYEIASKQINSTEILVPEGRLRDSNVLRVQGRIIGYVMSRTSIISRVHVSENLQTDNSNTSNGFSVANYSNERPPRSKQYYGTHGWAKVRTAVCCCLVGRMESLATPKALNKKHWTELGWYYRKFERIEFQLRQMLKIGVLQHTFDLAWSAKTRLGSERGGGGRNSRNDDKLKILHDWLQSNKSFEINGMALRRYQSNIYLGPTILALFLIGFIFFSVTIIYILNVLMIPILIIGIYVLFRWHKRFQNTRSAFMTDMLSDLDSPKRLIVSNEGFLSMASSAAALGDNICLLVGCTSPVLLREEYNRGTVQYKLIGKAFVYLSQEDEKIYEGFAPVNGQWPLEMLHHQRERGNLQEFQLI